MDLTRNIIDAPLYEKQQNIQDVYLYGLIVVVKTILVKYPEHKEEIGQAQGLTYHILHNCLFEFPKLTGKKN